MAELAEPAGGHREIAEHAADLGIELIAVGTDLYGVAPVDDAVAALGPLGGGDGRAREGQPRRRSAGARRPPRGDRLTGPTTVPESAGRRVRSTA